MKISLMIGRTTQPKQYHACKVELKIEDDVGSITAEQLDANINILYKTMKEKLNQIQEYEEERMRG